MENNYKYFEHIDRESDFITSGKSTIQFYFLNKYNTFVFSSLSPDGGITEITKAGSKFYKLYGDNETIIRKTFTVDTSFVEKLI